MKEYLYKGHFLILIVTNDEYEFPINVFDNVKQMAKYYNKNIDDAHCIVGRCFKGTQDFSSSYGGKIVFVKVDENF